MTLVESERSEARNVSGIILEAKRDLTLANNETQASETNNLNTLKGTMGLL